MGQYPMDPMGMNGMGQYPMDPMMGEYGYY
jgi:hypothetical protein